MPVGIVVQRDTAAAHYCHNTLSKGNEGKREAEHDRYTDVLVKEDHKWMYFKRRGALDD